MLFFGVSPLHGQSEATKDAETSFKEADARLNRVHQEALHALIRENFLGHPEEELRKSQRAWLTFRDEEASTRALIAAGSGSIYSTYFSNYLAELTDDRVKQLNVCYLEKLMK